MIPFYERMQQKDKELTAEAREIELRNIDAMQYHAAHQNGQCILNSIKLDDYAKYDEMKAIREADER